MVELVADASDDNAIGQVEFTLTAPSSASRYSLSTVAWDTGAAVRAPTPPPRRPPDAAGNEATDADTTVTVVAGPAPGMPPVVRLLSPAEGATVSGVPEIKIEAISSGGVVSQAVLFWKTEDMGDQPIGTDRAAPFTFLWDVRNVPEGPQRLAVRAFDAAGGVGLLEFTLVVSHSEAPEVDAGVGPDGGAGGAGGGDPGQDDGDGARRAGRSYWGCTQTPGSDAPAPGLAWLLLALPLLRRRKYSFALAFLLLAACEGDPVYVVLGDDAGPRGPARDAGGAGGAGGGGGALDLSNPRRVEAFLEGKVLRMAGSDVPSHPNGFDANVNFGQATQCYSEVEITVLGGSWTTRSVLGTLNGASDVGDVGMCDPATPGASLEFASTAVLIGEVRGNGTCFDVTATYAGFGQEGRGRISADGTTAEFEFFFKDQATGHRCADGDVGQAGTVTLNNMPFTGDAVQVYRIGQP
ncbi:MAG: Ig-like domain-containing protein [bacterium]